MQDVLGTLGPVQGAYHGTARTRLEDQRFLLKFILSGEGHLRYGFGLYFTQNKDIAKWYRDNDVADKAFDKKGMVADIGYARIPEPNLRQTVDPFSQYGHGITYNKAEHLAQAIKRDLVDGNTLADEFLKVQRCGETA